MKLKNLKKEIEIRNRLAKEESNRTLQLFRLAVEKRNADTKKAIRKVFSYFKQVKTLLKYRKVVNLFKIFYANVTINEEGYMVYIRCKNVLLSPDVFFQAKYCEGFDSDIETASTISHVIYTYLEKNGLLLDYPFYDSTDKETIIFSLMKEDYHNV